MLEVERVGRTKRYRPAVGSPLHEPLQQLLERSLGVEAQLRGRLAGLSGVEHAAIFGSWAAARPGPTSDIDLIVVGDVASDDLLGAVREVESLVGRDIDVVTYATREFRSELEHGSGFLTTLLEAPLTLLVGDLENV